MNQETMKFTTNTAQTINANGTYVAAIVSGTFTNVVISDEFNGTVATITTTDRTDLLTNGYGVAGVVTVTPSGVSGTVTVKLQWKDD